MTEKIQTLQEKIEERAKVKLNNDLYAFSQTIRENLLSHIPNSFKEKEKNSVLLQLGEPEEGKKNEPNALYNLVYYTTRGNSSTYMSRLYQAWLPIYIERETEDFVKKVDELVDWKENHSNDQL